MGDCAHSTQNDEMSSRVHRDSECQALPDVVMTAARAAASVASAARCRGRGLSCVHAALDDNAPAMRRSCVMQSLLQQVSMHAIQNVEQCCRDRR